MQAELRAIFEKQARAHRKEAWRKIRRKIILGIAAASLVLCCLLWQRKQFVPRSAETLEMWFVDVGQGDATLICYENAAVLIDCGAYGQGERVKALLNRLRISHLDAVIVTHPHADHIGGMTAALEDIDADAIYLPDFPERLIPTGYTFEVMLQLAEQRRIPLVTPDCGDTLNYGDLRLTMLSAENTAAESLNDCSLVCRAEYGDTSFLIMGDAAEAEERALMDAGHIRKTDVLRCGHHGSATSSTAAFLEAAEPAYAVISVGAGNDYGHPAAALLERVSARTKAVFRTDFDGSVCAVSDGKHIRFFTEAAEK